jgi:hypothetical protein
MKTTYKVEQSDLIGALEGFPIEVAQMMVDRQVEQGNEPNIKVFQKCLSISRQFGGFDWLDTPEGDVFWYAILADKKFNTFFEKYPKQEVEVLPAVNALFDTYRNAMNLLTSAQNQISDAINEIVKNLQGEKGYVKFDENTSFPYFEDDTIGRDAIIAARWNEEEGELQFITESQGEVPEDWDAEWFHWMDYGKFDFNEFVFVLEQMTK